MKLINRVLKELSYVILGIIGMALCIGFVFGTYCLFKYTSLSVYKGIGLCIVAWWFLLLAREIGQSFYGLITELRSIPRHIRDNKSTNDLAKTYNVGDVIE